MTDHELSAIDDLLELAQGHVRRARVCGMETRPHHIDSAIEALETARAVMARMQLDENHKPSITIGFVREEDC